MTREARICLPQFDNNKCSLAGVRDQLAAVLAEAFGGFTLLEGQGAWIGPEKQVYDGPVYVFEIACPDDGKTADALRFVVSMFKAIAEQEAVYLRLPSGEVEFV